MLSFDLSLLGWLLPLVALPALIHLLNRKFPRAFRFSSIEQIKKTMAQRSKLFRWRHFLLAILRTLALGLLLLAFLNPVRQMFGSSRSKTGARHVLVLFDHSLSMEAKEGSFSGRRRGLLEVEKLINTLGPDDLINVRVVGRTPDPCFPQFSTSQAEILRLLGELGPGLGLADFNKANAAAAQDFAKIEGRPEIYYVSDFQRATWGSVDFSSIPKAVRMFFVNVAPQPRANHAILGAHFQGAAALAGESAPLEIELGNFAGDAFPAKIEITIDGKQSVYATTTVPPWSTSRVTADVPQGGSGVHTIELRLPEDELPQDDHYFLSTRVAEKEEVLIVSDETGGTQHAGFFLSKALNPYQNLAGSLVPKSIGSAAMTGSQLAGARKLFLTRLDRLNEATCKQLADFLTGGGSILYFLDGDFAAQNLAALDQALGGGVVPLQLTRKQQSENLEAGSQQILRGDFKSKYLRLFRGSQRQNLALLDFYEFYHALPTGRGTVLLSYADGTPAMASANAGLGTLLVCNFSASELGSNIARQRVFPAWIQDLVKALNSDEPVRDTIEIGDEVSADVWQMELDNNAVKSPSGQAVRTNRELDGQRYHLTFTAAEQGIYRLAGGDALHAFAVNAPAAESDLRPLDLGLLPQRRGQGDQAHFVEGQEEFNLVNSDRPVYHYFVFGMLALLVMELGFLVFFKRVAG